MRRIFGLLIISLSMTGCNNNQTKELTMSHDEIVNGMIDLYTANGAVDVNGPVFKDSMRDIYYLQLVKSTGKSLQEIRRNFDALLLQPDTLLALQNIALDTLRAMQDRELRKSTPKLQVDTSQVNKLK